MVKVAQYKLVIIGRRRPKSAPFNPPPFTWIPHRKPRRPKPAPQIYRKRHKLAGINPLPFTWVPRRRPRRPRTELLLRPKRRNRIAASPAVLPAPLPRHHKHLIEELPQAHPHKRKAGTWLTLPPALGVPVPLRRRKRVPELPQLHLRKHRGAAWIPPPPTRPLPLRRKRRILALELPRRRRKVPAWIGIPPNVPGTPLPRRLPRRPKRTAIRRHKLPPLAGWYAGGAYVALLHESGAAADTLAGKATESLAETGSALDALLEAMHATGLIAEFGSAQDHLSIPGLKTAGHQFLAKKYWGWRGS